MNSSNPQSITIEATENAASRLREHVKQRPLVELEISRSLYESHDELSRVCVGITGSSCRGRGFPRFRAGMS